MTAGPKLPFAGVVQLSWLWSTDAADEEPPTLALRFDGGKTYFLTAEDWSALRDRVDRVGEASEVSGGTRSSVLALDGGGGS